MSEKKILCIEMESPCVKCGSGKLFSILATIKRYKSWPTREQTIETIAKALCRTDGDDCETCGFNGNEKGCKAYLEIGNYITQAEVALEDILDGKK